MKRETPSKSMRSRRNIFFAILLFLTVITITFLFSEYKLSHADVSALTSIAEHEVPDSMQVLAKEDNVEWMAGMFVKLSNCTSCPENIAKNIDSYRLDGDTIRADIDIQNGLDKVQPYFLMVFADGVPMEFRAGESTYLSYPLELFGAKQLQIEFQPEFSQQIGRLDFLAFYDGDPKSDFHMLSYTVWIEQSAEAKAPERLQPTVFQRNGVAGNYSGWTYGAWLWNEAALPESSLCFGPREITVQSSETLLLEAITGTPGKYRTVLVLNRTPVEITCGGVQYRFLDWDSTENAMLQIPVQLPKCDEGSFSFFTVTTPLDRDTLADPSFASFKIPLTYKEENP